MIKLHPLNLGRMYFLAKESNKYRVLVRRKQELDHAISHGMPLAALHKRAEKLRAAVVSVLKKRGSSCYMYHDTYWTTFQARWEALSVSEVIELASKWCAEPNVRDLRIGVDA
jgi:hypothetical protein